MANLDFFCMCLDHLSRRFPNRGLDQAAYNRLLIAVNEVEAAFESFPLIEKVNVTGAPVTEVAAEDEQSTEPQDSDAAGH